MNDLQWQASHPDSSIWVSASAGTGKTKILTDRVLRLLLNGELPEKILCLTFTNAAANEMQNRINTKLATWARMNEEELILELKNILGRFGSTKEILRAKTLYNKLLNFENRVELHTLHSYCQKTLKRFPLEAGINPGFQILDDIKAREVISSVKRQIYLDESCDDIIKFFLTNCHESTINDIFDEIIQQKIKFQKLKLDPITFKQTSILKNPGLFEDAKHLLDELLLSFPEFASEFYKDITDADDIYSKQKILSFFLTKDGAKKKRVIIKKLVDDHPGLLSKCTNLQDKVYDFDQEDRILEMLDYSYYLNNLAKMFIAKYEIYKKNRSLLDYDDLIHFTKKLLNDSNSKDWILYKLDGGIDHLLVDEAQDTSPEQWEIIEAIVSEFYSGQGARKEDRTIFIVGDEKQSIFSFQGADPSSINQMNNKIRDRLSAAKKNYKNINLEYSYRSSPPIIEVVHDIFERIKNSDPNLFPSDNPNITAFRNKSYGRVELWPLVSSNEDLSLFWPKPSDHDDSLSCQKQLAIKIASFIKGLINNNTILASTNLPARVQDFMILVRKRDNFTKEIINQLKEQFLETTGIDRMLLSQNISVMDLLSIAKFVLSPRDNLNLAILLKSPIIGLNDEVLQDLILLNRSRILWDTLKELDANRQSGEAKLIVDHREWNYDLTIKKLNYFIKLYNTTISSAFFSIIADSLGYRKLLISANGADSNDAIDELLYTSSNYAYNVDNSLQSFVYWFENNNIEVKRSVEDVDKIRIMTVHASKGLQAPVVILCDTTTVPTSRDKFFWTNQGQLLACQQAARYPNILKVLKEEQYHKDLQEYVRLLYVGTTRAEDYLIVCGYQSTANIPQNCWYRLVENSMKVLANTYVDSTFVFDNGIKNSAQNSVLKPSYVRKIEQNDDEYRLITEVCHANDESFYDSEIVKDVAASKSK
ncbi:MAG: UvrD-helicase domain-containing protein, partial [Janthinobacterium lividum]